MDDSLDLSSGAPAKVLFLRYPLITYHLVFMAQVFITTLLIAHWLNDEDFSQQYARPKWNYTPSEERGEENERFAWTGKTRKGSADE